MSDREHVLKIVRGTVDGVPVTGLVITEELAQALRDLTGEVGCGYVPPVDELFDCLTEAGFNSEVFTSGDEAIPFRRISDS